MKIELSDKIIIISALVILLGGIFCFISTFWAINFGKTSFVAAMAIFGMGTSLIFFIVMIFANSIADRIKKKNLNKEVKE